MHKLRKNNHGFAHIGLILLAVLVIAAISGVGYYVIGSDTPGSTNTNNGQKEGKPVVAPAGYVLEKTACYDVYVPPPDANNVLISDHCVVHSTTGAEPKIIFMTQAIENNGMSAADFVKNFDEQSKKYTPDHTDGNISEENIKVDGYKAVKSVYKEVGSTEEKVRVIADSPEYTINGQKTSLFVLEGWYNDDYYRTAFDNVLSSFRWK